MQYRPDMDAHLAAKKRQYARQKQRAKVIFITLLSITIAAVWALIITVAVRLAQQQTPPEAMQVTTVATENTAPDVPVTTAPPETTAPSNLQSVLLDTDMVYKGSLILVSSMLDREYTFPAGERLIPLYGNKSGSYRISSTALTVHPDTLAALNEMFDAYHAETGNRDYQITQAGRTYDEQKEIYDSYQETYGPEEGALLAALPGYSEHHAGYALDMNVYTAAGVSHSLGTASEVDPIYGWIYDRAAEYGFVLRFPEGKTQITGITNEPWHFRFVGKGHASYMTEKELVLEEYIALLYDHPQNKPLIFTYGGVSYTVFYVPVSGEKTEIYLPADAVYTLSGDNESGVIVTVIS